MFLGMEVRCPAPDPLPQTLPRPFVLYPCCLGSSLTFILVAHAQFLLVAKPRPSRARGWRLGLQTLLALAPVGMLALRSQGMARLAPTACHKEASAQAEYRKILADCPPAFAIPARQCLDLARHIFQEFTEAAMRHELDALLSQYRPPGTCPSYAALARPTLWNA